MKTKSNSQDKNFNYNDIKNYLNTDKEKGLSEEEVLKRRELFGLNALQKGKKEHFIVLFLKAIFCDLMSLLLAIAGIIALILAIVENIEKDSGFILSYIQACVLLSIVIINAFFGTIQEIKSNNAIDELEKMSSPTAKVLRDGKIKMIPSSEIVIGDILIVEAGDTVSADAILFKDSKLKISESILTGESLEVLKDSDCVVNDDAPLGDQKNKIFSGTNVLNGTGAGIVCGIGSNTEIGKIAKLLNVKENNLTPLQFKLQKLGKILGLVGIALTFITFIFSIFAMQNIITSPNKLNAFQSSLLLSISLAAAAIPEGLSAIVTIVLSIGVKKLSQKKALVKKLPSVETLGSTAVICSDKTGTLTMNKMTVVKLWTPQSNDNENPSLDDENKKDLIIKASLCTEAVIDENPDVQKRKSPIGDPTEISILDIAFANGISILNLKNSNKRIGEIPFDSDRKLMTSVNLINNKKILIVKGASDVVISRCTSNINPAEATRINNKWSDQAIRVLAVAYKEIYEDLPDDVVPENFENNLTFLGLIGMIDPPREEVKLSIKECIHAGIKPVMITGDHLNTAVAIAKDLGIIQDPDKQLAITGSELDKISDEQLYKDINKYSVYARVSPENKIRIVKAWQKNKQVVAMTGDGVNDAPALKAADIGCAMGITGTDVSKKASDMILMDDNFSTIVEAVKSGRNIYNNIRRITKFLLSSNVTSVFSIVFGMIIFYIVFQICGWGTVTIQDLPINLKNLPNANEIVKWLNQDITFQATITTIQILIYHMVIETFPGVAMGTQISSANLMNQRPRSKYESIFADHMVFQIFYIGLMHGIFTIVSFTIGAQIAIATKVPWLRFYYGSMGAFLTLTIGGVLKSISMSSTNYVFKMKWNETKWIYLTSLISLSLIMIVSFIPKVSKEISQAPVFSGQYSNIINNALVPNEILPWQIYLLGFGFAFLSFIFIEAEKLITNTFFDTKKEKNISEFQLIPVPLTFRQKHNFLNWGKRNEAK